MGRARRGRDQAREPVGVRFAAFLRGVNVGGNKKIDMATLRHVLDDAGMTRVATVLQSGNAVFDYDGPTRAALATRIEAAIEAGFGFSPTVLVRSLRDLERAIAADPLGELATDPARHLLGFLGGPPTKKSILAAESKSTGEDMVRVIGSHLYMWCPKGISRSPLFKVDFDRVLGTPVTMRNRNTVAKVVDLLRS